MRWGSLIWSKLSVTPPSLFFWLLCNRQIAFLGEVDFFLKSGKGKFRAVLGNSYKKKKPFFSVIHANAYVITQCLSPFQCHQQPYPSIFALRPSYFDINRLCYAVLLSLGWRMTMAKKSKIVAVNKC